jgi:hypothetical protein
MATRGARLHSYPNRFVEGGNLLAQLSPGREHRSDDRRDVVTAGEQGLDAPIERHATHRAGQQAKRLEHATDMVRQSRCHACELAACAKQRPRPMGVERLDMHRPIPSRAHDLRQFLCIILIGLVDLHLERSPRMPGVKARDVEPAAAQFVHQPWRHRTGFDADTGILSGMPMYRSLDLFRVRRALTTP